jgi:hypothetical protein
VIRVSRFLSPLRLAIRRNNASRNAVTNGPIPLLVSALLHVHYVVVE